MACPQMLTQVTPPCSGPASTSGPGRDTGTRPNALDFLLDNDSTTPPRDTNTTCNLSLTATHTAFMTNPICSSLFPPLLYESRDEVVFANALSHLFCPPMSHLGQTNTQCNTHASRPRLISAGQPLARPSSRRSLVHGSLELLLEFGEKIRKQLRADAERRRDARIQRYRPAHCRYPVILNRSEWWWLLQHGEALPGIWC